jgi:hypothetical protein
LENALSISGTDHSARLVVANNSLDTDDATVRTAHMPVSLVSGSGRVVPDGVEIPVGNGEI